MTNSKKTQPVSNTTAYNMAKRFEKKCEYKRPYGEWKRKSVINDEHPKCLVVIF